MKKRLYYVKSVADVGFIIKHIGRKEIFLM